MPQHLHLSHVLSVNLLFSVKKNRASVVDLQFLVFSGKCQLSYSVLFFKHTSYSRLLGFHATLVEFVSSRSLEVILFLLVGSLHISWCLLHILEIMLRDISELLVMAHMDVLLEKLHNLCTDCRYLMPPTVTKILGKSKAREKSLRKD